MRLSDKQKWSIKRSTSRLNLWEGSVRSTKTVGSIFRFIQAIPQASRDGEIFLIGKTLDSLKRNIILPMQEFLGEDIGYFPGKREVHLWDRTIYTVGANDERAEGKIRGVTASLIYGDEVTLWPESFFKMMDSRLSLEDSIFFGTTNADNPMHYLKRDYLDREENLDFSSFHFILDDNEFLSEKYRTAIKQNFVGLWYKRFILGLWCVAEGAIHDYFDEDEHVILKPPKADYYDVGIDYGTGNPSEFLLCGNSNTSKLKIWAEDEYFYDSKKHERQKTDSEYAKDLLYFLVPYTNSLDHIVENKYGTEELLRVKSERKKNRPLSNIFLDPSAASFKAELRQWGFFGLKDADNDVLDGIRTVSRMIKGGSAAICTRCINLIKEMYAYLWDSKAQERGEDKPLKKDDHGQDTWRYVLQTKFGKSFLDYSLLTRR